jgi:hypothetical protein
MTLPDPSYHISAEERAKLLPGVDADALERLLQHFSPGSRPAHLKMFSRYLEVADAPGRLPDRSFLRGSPNPELQRMIDAAWGRGENSGAGPAAAPRDRDPTG